MSGPVFLRLTSSSETAFTALRRRRRRWWRWWRRRRAGCRDRDHRAVRARLRRWRRRRRGWRRWRRWRSFSAKIQPEAGREAVAMQVVPVGPLITRKDHEVAVHSIAQARVTIDFRPTGRDGRDGKGRRRIAVEVGAHVVVVPL